MGQSFASNPRHTHRQGEAMNRLTSALVVGLCLVVSSPASAQRGRAPTYAQRAGSYAARTSASNFSASRIRDNILNRAVPNFSSTPRNMLNSSLSAARGGQPSAGRGQSAMNKQVRPLLDQAWQNRQAAAHVMRNELPDQLRSITAQRPYDPHGSVNMAPTGHDSVYMNYGGYFPPAQVQRKHQ
jgi:hypothetical protein